VLPKGNIHASFGDRMTPNPAIACDFEFLAHQNRFYLKFIRCLLIATTGTIKKRADYKK
jgi:hypothetical protein